MAASSRRQRSMKLQLWLQTFELEIVEKIVDECENHQTSLFATQYHQAVAPVAIP